MTEKRIYCFCSVSVPDDTVPPYNSEQFFTIKFCKIQIKSYSYYNAVLKKRRIKYKYIWIYLRWKKLIKQRKKSSGNPEWNKKNMAENGFHSASGVDR